MFVRVQIPRTKELSSASIQNGIFTKDTSSRRLEKHKTSDTFGGRGAPSPDYERAMKAYRRIKLEYESVFCNLAKT